MSSVNSGLTGVNKRIRLDYEITQKSDHSPFPVHVALERRHRTTLCRSRVQKQFVKDKFCVLIKVLTDTSIENKSTLVQVNALNETGDETIPIMANSLTMYYQALGHCCLGCHSATSIRFNIGSSNDWLPNGINSLSQTMWSFVISTWDIHINYPWYWYIEEIPKLNFKSYSHIYRKPVDQLHLGEMRMKSKLNKSASMRAILISREWIYILKAAHYMR